jgi:hypothetical protein
MSYKGLILVAGLLAMAAAGAEEPDSAHGAVETFDGKPAELLAATTTTAAGGTVIEVEEDDSSDDDRSGDSDDSSDDDQSSDSDD